MNGFHLYDIFLVLMGGKKYPLVVVIKKTFRVLLFYKLFSTVLYVAAVERGEIEMKFDMFTEEM